MLPASRSGKTSTLAEPPRGEPGAFLAAISGTRAALPIWVDFMKAATSGLKPTRLPSAPEGIVYATIDKETGLLAGPRCLERRDEAFVAGTEPREICGVHGN